MTVNGNFSLLSRKYHLSREQVKMSEYTLKVNDLNSCNLEQVTRSLAAKAFQTSLPLCRETFFSAAMEDHLVLRLVMETSIRIACQFSQPLTFPHFHCLKSNDPFVLFLSFSLMNKSHQLSEAHDRKFTEATL